VAEKMSENMKQVGRRYMRDMGVAAILYTGVIFAGAYAVRALDLPQWLVVVAAIAPMLPALLMLRAYLVFVNSIDEFQRRIQMEAILIAAGITGFGSFAYGFLEEWAGFPHLPLIWVLPVLIGTWGVAACFVRLRYK
jgi:hypothetical protein